MYYKLIIQIIGGLALFIFGINTLSDGLQKITSNNIKSIIGVLSRRPWASALVGLATTLIIQSSSATSVMTVGFVNAGLISLKTAIGIIMGANIGTTITAQIVSLNIVGLLTYPLLIIGFILFFTSKRRRYKNIGMAIIGLGLLFLGMGIMKESLDPLKDNQSFKNFLLVFSRNPFLGVLAGLLLTSLLQSSSATIGILIALASQGLIPIEAAIPILFGDNIGTCTTALLSSIGTTVTAKRTAFSHLLFNVLGTIIFITLFYGFRLEPFILRYMGSSVPRQIANMHTAFNAVTTAILFPLIGLFEKLVVKLYPGKDIIEHKNAIHLDNRLIKTPSVALEQAKKELLRLTKIVQMMDSLSFQRLKSKDTVIEKKVLDREAAVDSITEDIIRYLTQLSRQSLTLKLSNKLINLMQIAYDTERTGDHAESLLNLMILKDENRTKFTKVEIEELEELSDKVNEMFNVLIKGMENGSFENLVLCEQVENDIDAIVKNSRLNHILRLQKGECMPVSGVIFSDILLHFERTGDLLHGISKNMIEIGKY
ncbi:MAG TPA: Na/Pi cotransporter family protein [Actinobacteria bacterium]|nr:Na/Pi cotransporter family protein [Actinomycetota bacterium]